MNTYKTEEKKLEKSLIIRFFFGIVILITVVIIALSFQNSDAENRDEPTKKLVLKPSIQNIQSSSAPKALESVNTIFTNY